MRAGAKVVVAQSFARIFFRNCVATFAHCLTLPAWLAPSARMEQRKVLSASFSFLPHDKYCAAAAGGSCIPARQV